VATFDKRGDLQWRAQIRRKGYPVQRKTFLPALFESRPVPRGDFDVVVEINLL